MPTQAITSHWYMDVVTAYGSVLVLLLEVSQFIGGIVAAASFLAWLLPINFRLLANRKFMGTPYGVIAIAVNIMLYWKMDGMAAVASAILVGSGTPGVSTGMLMVVNRLLNNLPPAQT